MSDNNDEPRSSQAPAGQSGQRDADKAAPIRDTEAYERSQAEKAARLASKSLKENESLKAEIADLKNLLSGFVGELKAEKEARATADKTAKREQLTSAAAAQFNLPAELAKRLQGETAEEILADAKFYADLGISVETPNPAKGQQKPPAPTNQGRTIAMGNVPANNGADAGSIGRRLAERAINGRSENIKFTQPFDPDDN